MAIINSIGVGKGRGKIGNVIYQSYNGLTVMRQKNDVILTPPTDLQIAQQNKLFNCGRAYQFLANFLTYWKPRNFKGLSNSAVWTKLVSQEFLNTRALRGAQSVRALAEKAFGLSSFINIFEVSIVEALGVKTGIRVDFNSLTSQWEDNLTIYVHCSNVFMSGGTYPVVTSVMRDVPVTLEDVTAGYKIIDIEDFDTQFVVAYCTQYYSYSDCLYFSAIFD